MNIKNVKYLNNLKKLGYPLNEMLIVGSGTMSLYGLKENNDIDLWVTKKVYDKMLKDDRFSSNGKMLETKDGLIEADHRFICVKQPVEYYLKNATVVNGFYFMSLGNVLDWKKCMGRPKDHEHIKMIEKYMKKHNIIESYLQNIQESYIFSDKTISFDLDKFENGESNLLLVAGLSASGKTTLAEKLAKKYKCEFKESDNPCLSEEDNKEGGPIKCYENIFHKLLKSKKRYIIEGVLVFWSCLDKDNNISPFFNECKNIPIIIMGESVMKSAYQGWKRDSGKISYVPSALKWYVKYGISDMKSFNIFKKARMNVSGTKIEEFKL